MESKDTREPSAAREIGSFFSTLLMLLILYVSILFILERAFKWHWLAGTAAILFYFWGLVLGIQDLRSREARKFPLRKGLAIFSLLALAGAAVFGAVSFLLSTLGWAGYTSQEPLELLTFHNYYLWLFFDMLPGLKINETLNLNAPLKPVGVVAGIPAIAFRAYIIYGVLSSLKTWWRNLDEKTITGISKSSGI